MPAFSRNDLLDIVVSLHVIMEVLCSCKKRTTRRHLYGLKNV
jgi:hypothetical protein